MTACRSKGRSTTYPYYLCDTRNCPEKRKSFRRERLEGDYETLLTELRPSEGLFHLAFDIFRDQWDAKVQGVQTQSTSLR